MPQRDDKALLNDMMGAARSALTAIEGADFSSLGADHVRTLGLVKCLEIIGEAARQLGSDFKAKHSAVPWSTIVGMRNRLVHAYFDVDYEQVWETLTGDLPPLVQQLETILSGEMNETR